MYIYFFCFATDFNSISSHDYPVNCSIVHFTNVGIVELREVESLAKDVTELCYKLGCLSQNPFLSILEFLVSPQSVAVPLMLSLDIW